MVLQLRRPFSDGTRAVKFSGEEFVKALALIVPPSWQNQVRYWGVFGPNHRFRSQVVNYKRSAPPSYRLGWAEVLKATFNIDRTVCGNCGSNVKIISVIRDYDVARKILKSMNQSGVPP